MDRKRLTIVSSILTFTAFMWWVTATVTLPDRAIIATDQAIADYSIEGLQLVRMDTKGARKFSLSANHLTHYPLEGLARLDHVYLVQYQRNGITIHTRADKARFPDSGLEIMMQQNVRIVRKRHNEVLSDIRSQSTHIILTTSNN